MSTHPNRSKHQSDRPGRTPKPHEIKRAREAANLTPTEAAKLLYLSVFAWRQWEDGRRRMLPALWELWLIKAFIPKTNITSTLTDVASPTVQP